MLRDARVQYDVSTFARPYRNTFYYSLLERYMKHVFVAGLVTGDFFLSLFFPAISVGVYANTFTQNVRTGVLFMLSG